ncbi:MAG: hypothetical protein GXO18_07325 [Aquificae bacterium]|nr:hypothetical protein [Aquificota bacterium]
MLVILFLLLGIAGLILPFLPGFPFLIVALYLLGFIGRRKMLRLTKGFKGRKGSRRRKIVGWIFMRLLYRRRLNLK